MEFEGVGLFYERETRVPGRKTLCGLKTNSNKPSQHVKYIRLLYEQECFPEKYTTHKIHTKQHPGPEWGIFHIVTRKDIDDVISRLCMVGCANSQ